MASLAQQIAEALAGVAVSVPDVARVMRHGESVGNAISSSSVEMTGDAATDSGAVEKSRVIVTASDFPSLDSDAFVTVGGDPHVVTSLKADPVGATLTVGLSEALSKVLASVAGARGQRAMRFAAEILAECNGLANDNADGYAATGVYSWTIVIPTDEWPEPNGPQAGDEFRFEKNGDHRLRVSRCARRDGRYVINARSR